MSEASFSARVVEGYTKFANLQPGDRIISGSPQAGKVVVDVHSDVYQSVVIGYLDPESGEFSKVTEPGDLTVHYAHVVIIPPTPADEPEEG